MKRILLLSLLIPLASISAYGQTCDDTLMRHVYHPNRLVVRKGCITVTGTIRSETPEGDGDIHMRLQLDPGQGVDLINQANNTSQHGFLVFEPLCQKAPTQQSAKAACRHFKQNITVPPSGTRVRVTGMHMFDADHGWLEIHPVTTIEVLP